MSACLTLIFCNLLVWFISCKNFINFGMYGTNNFDVFSWNPSNSATFLSLVPSLSLLISIFGYAFIIATILLVPNPLPNILEAPISEGKETLSNLS